MTWKKKTAGHVAINVRTSSIAVEPIQIGWSFDCCADDHCHSCWKEF